MHGLFGSARNWGVIARRLSDRREVLAVDMRNHGESPRLLVQGYPEMAEDLAAVIAHHGGRADVLGHSMGGKAAMMLALTAATWCERLVVADIAPVAYAHDQSRHIAAMRSFRWPEVRRAARRIAALARRIDRSGPARLLPAIARPQGQPPRWRLNLDVLEAEMPKIVGWPDPGGRFDGPTLFLSGGVALRPAGVPRGDPGGCFRQRALRRFPARATGCTPRNRASSRKRCGSFWAEVRTGGERQAS